MASKNEMTDPPTKGPKAYLYMAWLIFKMWFSRVRDWAKGICYSTPPTRKLCWVCFQEANPMTHFEMEGFRTDSGDCEACGWLEGGRFTLMVGLKER